MRNLTTGRRWTNLKKLVPHESAEFGSSFRTGAVAAMRRQAHGFFIAYPFMVGVLGSRKACRNLFPVFQLDTSTARCLEASGGSLKTTEQEATMPSNTKKPTKNSVSQKSGNSSQNRTPLNQQWRVAK